MSDTPKRDALILVVDDVDGIRQFFGALLRDAGYRTLEAADGHAALALARTHAPDLVLLDIRMPGLSGMEVLKELRRLDPALPVVMVTGLDDVDTAVEAMHLGADDYLTKPVHNAEALTSIERALERRRAAATSRPERQRSDRFPPLTELLGISAAIARLETLAAQAAAETQPVLITGEPGTGKEFVARAIHALSTRSSRPFVAVDCDNLVPAVADAELFGLAAGADTGPDRVGQIELAQGGTLFLRNVSSLPLCTQDLLLAFLQSGCAARVGAAEATPRSVRLLACTSLELRELVGGHLFRQGLYAALTSTVLQVPPVRERPDDLLSLLNSLIEATNRELGKHVAGPTPSALELLQAYPWPGNLRELRSVVRRAVLHARDHIEPQHLMLGPRHGAH